MNESTYLAERRSLIEATLEMSRRFDITATVLSAGCVVASIAYLRTLDGTPQAAWLFHAACMSFTLALSTLVVGMLMSLVALARQQGVLGNVYTGSDEPERNGWAIVTNVLNAVSTAALVCGLGFLCAFVCSNSFGRGP